MDKVAQCEVLIHSAQSSSLCPSSRPVAVVSLRSAAPASPAASVFPLLARVVVLRAAHGVNIALVPHRLGAVPAPPPSAAPPQLTSTYACAFSSRSTSSRIPSARKGAVTATHRQREERVESQRTKVGGSRESADLACHVRSTASFDDWSIVETNIHANIPTKIDNANQGRAPAPPSNLPLENFGRFGRKTRRRGRRFISEVDS